MDAGISTKENLDLIKEKGYNYLCVTRKALTDYSVKEGAKTVNIIRHQLKKANERREMADPNPEAEYPTPYWPEIADIMKTQKVVKSEATNTLGEKVDMLICSTPI